MNYMQQRYYDPELQIFYSVDAVTALSNPFTSFHRYRYAANNPYRFIDPDGRRAKEAFREMVEGGGGAGGASSSTVASANSSGGGGGGREGVSRYSPNRGQESSGRGRTEFSLPGTEAGAKATQYWADKEVQTGNSAYAVPGALASLWTPETAGDTSLTLGGGVIGRPVGAAYRWAGGAMLRSSLLGPSGGIFGRQALGGSSLLNINNNPALRVGWGWVGTANNGANTFRISGDWVRSLGIKSGHVDLWVQKAVTP